ncbi:hypothetical protein CTM97_18405 [Photobacterium phosphoreum]|uniref:Uncharacterized protein n=1 Tax=Photobacterium phosphoreum TaxID=659 RepID=A0A2T3JBU3_PHOPO|nr:hypothetical protein [Photobacterium phosphoreum]PSU19915.1 hypothetical protein CTM96_20385 [Photobacterium phosphoreum]PSU38763.1 hypothetical protein CTM97_18405 [Photobacterium phosphoreum]PSU46313.1 hypothetical protein C9J18_20845 [Photobacterium phosphoreum]
MKKLILALSMVAVFPVFADVNSASQLYFGSTQPTGSCGEQGRLVTVAEIEKLKSQANLCADVTPLYAIWKIQHEDGSLWSFMGTYYACQTKAKVSEWAPSVCVMDNVADNTAQLYPQSGYRGSSPWGGRATINSVRNKVPRSNIRSFKLAKGVALIGYSEENYEGFHKMFTESTTDSLSNIKSYKLVQQFSFDYDKSLLPAETEATFALRLKNVLSSGMFFLDLSGHYLLTFTQDKIVISDKDTKKSSVYKYVSDSPNITIGLGISKGLANNYKNIVIKEDSDGQLYDYEAFHSDNITSDNAKLSKTIEHPFYVLLSPEGTENRVTVSKSMAFYHELPAHERHARCVRPNMTLLEEFREIFSSGSVICSPKPASDIYSANHNSVDEMRLEQALTEAAIDNKKYGDLVGYQLWEGFDLKDSNTIAFLTSSRYCRVPVMTRVENKRHKRSPAPEDCLNWTSRIIELYVLLGLNFIDIYNVVHNVIVNSSIPSSLFPGSQYPPNSEENRQELIAVISQHSNEATYVLQLAAGMTGMAAMASRDLRTNSVGETASLVEIQRAVSDASLGIYTLEQQNFRALDNVVKILNGKKEVEVQEGQSYTTEIITIAPDNVNDVDIQTSVARYRRIFSGWEQQIEEMIDNANKEDANQLELGSDIINYILLELEIRLNGNHSTKAVLGGVFHQGNLIGISYGVIELHQISEGYTIRSFNRIGVIVNPSSLLNVSGAYRGATAYLSSEILKKLFDEKKITKAKVDCVSKYSAKSFCRLGFRYDDEL